MYGVLGDMQLTKKEIAETQIIVTTPEKWDVVTRKPTGEGEVASVSSAKIYNWNPRSSWCGQTVKLLVIDEVHLLNDDRGAVIETIVARTLRQVSQPIVLYKSTECNYCIGRVQSICHPHRGSECHSAKLYRRWRFPEVCLIFKAL